MAVNLPAPRTALSPPSVEPRSRTFDGLPVALAGLHAQPGLPETFDESLAACRNYLLLIADAEVDADLRAKVGASDLVQETLLDAKLGHEQFDGATHAQFLAWLRGILLNKITDAGRHYNGTQKRRLTREVSLERDLGSRVRDNLADPTAETPSRLVCKDERAESFARAMAETLRGASSGNYAAQLGTTVVRRNRSADESLGRSGPQALVEGDREVKGPVGGREWHAMTPTQSTTSSPHCWRSITRVLSRAVASLATAAAAKGSTRCLGRVWRKAQQCLDVIEQLRRRDDVRLPVERLAPVECFSETPSRSDSPTACDGLSEPRAFGRFQIVRELGRGGFGVVFLAHDPVLRRDVALKVPRPDALLTPDLRRRFLREAQAAARLTHPNLVAVHEVGEVGPICFIAAAFCDGPTLAAWLRDRAKPAPPRLAAHVVAALADAVHYAHTQGVLHRDLKPSNVLLESNPTIADCAGDDEPRFVPKLTDFGLAKLAEGEAQDAPTRSGAMLGTPAYMAPEQADGRLDEVGPGTDVYALGALLYELLTGQPVFRGSTDLDTLHRVLVDEPMPPRRLQADLPRDLEAICLMCLEKQPGRRYGTAAALAWICGGFWRARQPRLGRFRPPENCGSGRDAGRRPPR